MCFSIVFFLMALLRLPIALLLYSLSFLWFSHDLPVTVICSCPWCYFVLFQFSLFFALSSFVFLWFPLDFLVASLFCLRSYCFPWLSHYFLCFTCGFLCFSPFCCFPIVVLWLCAPTVFLGSPMALLGFAIWFPVVFLGPPYEKLNRNQETLEINGNQCKNKVSQDPRTIRTPPPPPN